MRALISIRSALFTLLVVATMSGSAQQRDRDVEFLFYTSPLSAIPFLANPQITFGTEVVFHERWSLSAEAGYKFMDTYERQADTAFVESAGYSARVEYKAYENNIWDGRLANDYFAIEYRYISDNYNESYCYYDPTQLEIGRSYEDHFSVFKQVHVLTAKYGFVVPLGRSLYVDPYAGIGLRYRQVENTERLDLDYFGYALCDGTAFFANREWEDKSGIAPSVSLGFKVGLRF